MSPEAQEVLEAIRRLAQDADEPRPRLSQTSVNDALGREHGDEVTDRAVLELVEAGAVEPLFGVGQRLGPTAFRPI
jgi:hypothetical protein